MRAREIERRLTRAAVETSGHDPERYATGFNGGPYLGMSQIGKKEGDLVAMMQGKGWQPSEEDHLRLRLGHVFETVIEGLLFEAGLVEEDVIYGSELEVVADFDERFRGHIDGWFTNGALLEIKSTFQEKLDRLMASRRLPGHVYEQVQLYMVHGGFKEGYVVYIARDTGRMWVCYVRPNRAVVEKLNAKAKRVLAQFDALTGASKLSGEKQVGLQQLANIAAQSDAPIKVEA